MFSFRSIVIIVVQDLIWSEEQRMCRSLNWALTTLAGFDLTFLLLVGTCSRRVVSRTAPKATPGASYALIIWLNLIACQTHSSTGLENCFIKLIVTVERLRFNLFLTMYSIASIDVCIYYIVLEKRFWNLRIDVYEVYITNVFYFILTRGHTIMTHKKVVCNVWNVY